MIRRTTLSMLLSVLIVGGCGGGYIIRDAELWDRADRFARNNLIIDTHIDLPYRLEEQMEDISERTEHGDFDFVRARQGRLDLAFVAVYVSPKHEDAGDAKEAAEEQIDLVEGFAETWGDKFALVRSSEEIDRRSGDGRVLLAMGIENGAPVEGKLENVQYFYDRGVRYITLCHSKSNHICDSSYDTNRRWNGLSPFGKELIAEMNRVGMMIDVSHISDEAFYQVLELSKVPVIASHSSCRHFTPGWERNMTDDMIKAIAAKGGVVQINFGSIFINAKANAVSRERWEHIDNYVARHDLQGQERSDYVSAYTRSHPIPRTHLSDVVANIDRAVRLAGIDHVGLGSDFDGVSGNLPEGLRDVSGYRNLVYELMEKGYTEDDIRKICGLNFLRVWDEIDRAAR